MLIFYQSGLAQLLLFGKFRTMMFFGVIITKNTSLTDKSKRHEGTHIKQYWECLLLGLVLWILIAGIVALCGGHVSCWWLCVVPLTYYLMYGATWAVSYLYHILKGDAREKWNDAAYHASAFEMEAYAHEDDPNYLPKRKWYAFTKYYGTI